MAKHSPTFVLNSIEFGRKSVGKNNILAGLFLPFLTGFKFDRTKKLVEYSTKFDHLFLTSLKFYRIWSNLAACFKFDHFQSNLPAVELRWLKMVEVSYSVRSKLQQLGLK